MTELTEMTDQKTHVVVVGGGYAGTLAANHLRLDPNIDISLVNPRPMFVERIRLHQLVANSGTATVDYGTLLGDGIRLVVDSADRIDTADRRVRLTSGAVLNYDYLIYAVGSTGAMPAVPGAAEFAYSVADLESAKRLRYALADLHTDAAITVVGGGLTGIETASELAEQGRRVTLVCGSILGPSLSKRGRRSVANQLRKLGVDVLESAAVSQVRWDAVVLADGAVLPSAVTVWTAGFGVPDLATRSGLRRRNADQHRRRTRRRCRRRRRTVGPAVADELPSRRAVGDPSRQHRAQPHRRERAGSGEPGVRGAVHQPGPLARHVPTRAHR
jgi:NADH:ubiquinone reductase (H+-translocating)